MKPIKEWSWKYWIVVYIIFMVLLSVASTLFLKQGINIHAGYIFTLVVLMHFLLKSKNLMVEHILLRYMLVSLLLFSIIKLTITEFYTNIKLIDIIYKLFLVAFIISVLYYVISDRIEKRKEHKKKMKEIIDKEETKEAEILDEIDVPIEDDKSEKEGNKDI